MKSHTIKNQERDETKGIIYLLITAIIWGGSFISQLFGGMIMGPFSFTSFRGIFGCITIAIMIYIDNFIHYKKFIFFKSYEDKIYTIKYSLWCGFILFFAMITQQIGVQLTDTAKSGLIASLEVIVVPILMLIIYKRKMKLITWLFVVLAMIGIMMLSVNSISGINVGDVWVFLSTILYSFTIIQIPKYIKNIDPMKFSFFRFIMIGLMGYLFALIFRENIIDANNLKMALPSILYSGVLASGVAYTFQVIGQKHCVPVIATLIMSLEGIFAAIFGWIILGQSLNLLQILGIIIAFISIVMAQITDY